MIINGTEYRNVPITFNVVCRLEEMGVNVSDMGSHMLTAVRAYAAICMKKNKKETGIEIEQHITNGGTMNDIITPFAEEVEKSDFFQNLAAQAQEAAKVQPVEETTEIEDIEA